jgi:hypothetical protein
MRKLSHKDVMYEGGGRSKKNKSKSKEDDGIVANIFSCFGNKNKAESGSENTHEKWETMSPEQKKERIQNLWSKARRYNNKLRF